MLKGITENGEMKNLKVNEEGKLLVQSEEKAMEVVQTSDKETVLNASILMLSTENTEIEVNSNVTSISIANYSDIGDVSMTIEEKIYQIGTELAVELPINKNITTIQLNSTVANTKVQMVVKGVK